MISHDSSLDIQHSSISATSVPFLPPVPPGSTPTSLPHQPASWTGIFGVHLMFCLRWECRGPTPDESSGLIPDSVRNLSCPTWGIIRGTWYQIRFHPVQDEHTTSLPAALTLWPSLTLFKKWQWGKGSYWWGEKTSQKGRGSQPHLSNYFLTHEP